MGTSRREINRPFVMEAAARFYTLFPHLGDFIAGNILNKNKGVDQVMKINGVLFWALCWS